MADLDGIGTERPLKVRFGNTLRPQIITLLLTDGTILDDTGGQLVAHLYKRLGDPVPLSSPTFTVTRFATSPGTPPIYRLDLSKAQVSQLALVSQLESVGGGFGRRPQFVRRAWWTCSFEDASGMAFPLYYGSLTIVMGASGA